MDYRWQNYVKELIKLIQAYLLAVIYFGLFRIFLIIYFYKKIDSSTNLGDIILTMFHGFRFDSSVAAIFLLIPFFANMVCSSLNYTWLSAYLRVGFSSFLIIFMNFTFVITVPYFKEYDSQFDYFLFELIYDDLAAIFQTMIYGYNFFGILFIYAVSVIFCLFLMGRWQRLPFTSLLTLLTRSRKKLYRSIVLILMIILTFTATRGSFGARPAMRKWADITTDTFLNKMVMNPIRHLQYAYKDFKSISSKSAGIEELLGNTSVKEAAQDYFSLEPPKHQANDLSYYLLKTAHGNSKGLPDHIFLIVMESYDSWLLLPEYESLHITDSLKSLGRNGIFFDHFLPSGSSTMASLSTILTGIPFTGVNISKIAARKPPFITSTPNIFKRLGYTTRLYYGGFLSWQNIGNLFTAQGIDAVFAAPTMEGENSDEIWGVQDEQLFKFVLANTPIDEKTFNIILTTSYHPPFDLDVRSMGYHLYEIPKDFQSIDDGSITVNQLGHIWYGDREIGKFVSKMEKLNPNSLFAFTGDHYGRRFFNSSPTIYEHSSVPFILYSRNFIMPQTTRNKTPGSHIDIIPTIVELIAPKGFLFHSFGRSMLDKLGSNKNTNTVQFGIGYNTIVTDSFIANYKYYQKPASLSDNKFLVDNNIDSNIRKMHDQLLGMGRWLIFYGTILDTISVSD